jgi:hypothetical protein
LVVGLTVGVPLVLSTHQQQEVLHLHHAMVGAVVRHDWGGEKKKKKKRSLFGVQTQNWGSARPLVIIWREMWNGHTFAEMCGE